MYVYVYIYIHIHINTYIYGYGESLSVVSDSLRPHGLYSPWNSPGQNTGVGSLCLLQGLFPTQESNPVLLHCRDSLPAEPQGKPKNTVVDSISLLKHILPTQESNWGLLHCQWICYQLSYQGSPIYVYTHTHTYIYIYTQWNMTQRMKCCHL